MLWKMLADAALATHAAWVLAVVLGPIWCWRRPKWRAAHLAMLAVTMAFSVVPEGCPLTYLENHFLSKADPAASYPGSFLAHYMGRIVYWEAPESSEWAFAAATGIWFFCWTALYVWLWWREGAFGRPKAVTPRRR